MGVMVVSLLTPLSISKMLEVLQQKRIMSTLLLMAIANSIKQLKQASKLSVVQLISLLEMRLNSCMLSLSMGQFQCAIRWLLDLKITYQEYTHQLSARMANKM